MCGHLRLLNIACAAKAKPRLVTLTKPSRDSPLAFTLLGGQEKGFCIFIDAVEPGSKAAEAGLKRGDQVTFTSKTLVKPVLRCGFCLNIFQVYLALWHSQELFNVFLLTTVQNNLSQSDLFFHLKLIFLVKLVLYYDLTGIKRLPFEKS